MSEVRHDLPHDRWPTPAEFVDWFIRQPRDGQEGVAERVIRDGQAAARCFEQDHDGDRNRLRAALTAAPGSEDRQAGRALRGPGSGSAGLGGSK